MKLEVGQKLWYVPNERRNKSYEVTVEKIGRKWATTNLRWIRVNIETMWVDGQGYYSPGRCYLNEEEYLRETALMDAWVKFRWLIDRAYSVPKGIDESSIAHVINVLRLDE